MMHFRFTSLPLGLLLTLVVVLTNSSNIAFAHKEIALVANNGQDGQALGTHVKELNEENEMIAATHKYKRMMRGRKIGGVGEARTSEAQTGANPNSVGKCGHGSDEKGGLSTLECELRSGRSPSSRFTNLVGLIPFSSDYHAPKGHPPKNN